MFSFDPNSIKTIASMFTLGGDVNSSLGGFYSAKNQITNLNFQANMSDINAQLSENAAQQSLFSGLQDAANITQKAGQVKSSQRAALAANGVDLGVGSAAEQQASTVITGEADSNTAMANAIRNAWGYRMQATNFKNDAMISRASAKTISPSQSLLGGIGKVAASWYSLFAK